MVDLNIELPDGFLDEEVRCGYTVTSKMKEVWAVELDITAKIIEVCEKYNIKILVMVEQPLELSGTKDLSHGMMILILKWTVKIIINCARLE